MKKKNLLTRTIIIAVVTVVGLYLVIGPRHRPTVQDFTWSGIKQTLAHNIHLGLDLQGGSHLVMRVKTEEFLRRLTEDNYVAAQNAAKDAGFEIKNGRADVNSNTHRIVLERVRRCGQQEPLPQHRVHLEPRDRGPHRGVPLAVAWDEEPRPGWPLVREHQHQAPVYVAREHPEPRTRDERLLGREPLYQRAKAMAGTAGGRRRRRGQG